jgi:hypothetical protein
MWSGWAGNPKQEICHFFRKHSSLVYAIFNQATFNSSIPGYAISKRAIS